MNNNLISKWFSLFVMLTLVGITNAFAQSLSIADFAIEPGAEKVVTIDLNQDGKTIYGVQADLQVSQGLTLVGAPAVVEGCMDNTGNNSPSLTYNQTNGRFSLLSMSDGAAFKADATSIVTLTLKADENFDGGTVSLSNVRITTSMQGNELKAADVVAQVTKEEAEPTETVVNGYLVDFNTAITTSNHGFKVAKGWGHIVPDSNYDGYGPYYMNYSYGAGTGVDGTGTLYAARQYAGDYRGGEVIYDLLITPVVNGTVTIDAKASSIASSSNNAFIEVYAINEDGTRGDLLKTIKEEMAGYNSGSNTEWATFTLAELNEGQKLGLRLQYVYVDNFTATTAIFPKERSLEVTKVASLEGNTGTQGTNPIFAQQADGTMKVQLQVTLSNTGDYDFAAGDITLTPAYSGSAGGDKTFFEDATVTLAETALAVGETKTVDVDFFTPFVTGYKYWFVRENISNTTSSTSRYATSAAYESKFVFRAAESTASSSLVTESWGTITESTTKSYEIANTGTAPLTVTAITLPEGFTCENLPEIPAEGLVVEAGEKLTLDITNDATVTGNFAGTLTISYIAAGATAATDYTLAFSASVIGANTWTADFNNSTSTPAYPAGSVKESGISNDWDSRTNEGLYNIYLKGYNAESYARENNKFITPKLHATAGEQLAFDVKAGYSTSNAYFVKVYVSADRKNWGEPVATYTYSATENSEAASAWTTKSVSFDAEGDYYVAFALYGSSSAIDNLVGLEKVDVAHDLYIKSVSWPDASIKSGVAQTKPSVDIIPLTDEAADNYSVKYIYGDNEVEIASKALTASASSTTNFAASFTPEVEQTTTFEGTRVVFEFADGTKFETETFDLTVTNEPIFHFLSSKYTSRWYEPSSDYTTPVNFGKTNVSGAKKTFYVLNWGSAPLTVKSIAVPEGFTASVTEMTIPAFDGTQDGLETCQQALDITFSATEAGNYSGNLVITYVNGAGEDATFELALSGTMLDPTLFYANFGSESNQWPAGTVYQNNVSTTYVASGNYAITSSSTTNNLFITPKLIAQEGDKLQFDAKLYNSSWSEGKVVVYAAASREEILNTTENSLRTQLLSVSGEDETAPMTTDYQTFEVTLPAGEWYIGFEISGRPYVDEIYGLQLAEVAHDWMVASYNIPQEAMQNVATTATVNLLNLGLQEEAAGSYDVTVYVDGEPTTVEGAVALPTTNKLSDAGTQLSVSFRTPKVGTFNVYVEVSADGYSVYTDNVSVTFSEEVFINEPIEVGTGTTKSNNYAPIDFYDFEQPRTSDIVYTAEQLAQYGVKAGDKITSLAFKGTINSAKTLANSTLTAWVGLKSGDITFGTPDKDAMTEVAVYGAGQMVFEAGENDVTITLPEAITYDGTDLRIYLEGGGNGEYASLTFAYDTNYSNMKWSNATQMKYNPLLYVALAGEPATFTGTVTDGKNAVAGATITLVSVDGDNVQYTGTTDAEGAFSINVIQAMREYQVTVTAEGYDPSEAVIAFGGESQTQDFVLGGGEPEILLGDVNGDGEVTTTDAVPVIDFALEIQTPTEEQFVVADVNKSQDITVSDAVGIVNLALDKITYDDLPSARMVAGNNFLMLNGTEVMLQNSSEFVGFQIDVMLADGAQLNGVQRTSRTAAHHVAYNRVGENTWRIMVISMNNDAISQSEGALLSLNITGNQNVTIVKNEFTDAYARAYVLGLGETTGIGNINANAADAEVYTLGGARSDKMRKGMNVVRQADGTVRKVMVK